MIIGGNIKDEKKVFRRPRFRKRSHR
jgi:hypothetical protein